MFVKICGITREEDADLAVALGATALGFIFWPGSPRYIEPAVAATIISRVKGQVRTVGVFVNENLARMNAAADMAGVDVVQLHGDETPDYCARAERDVIKAIGITNGDASGVARFGDRVLILLDAHDPVRRGGTGTTIDWHTARQLAAVRPVVLSGGLNATNIRQAVEVVQPFGVDVSSGVESAPGVKDSVKLKTFFEALNG